MRKEIKKLIAVSMMVIAASANADSPALLKSWLPSYYGFNGNFSWQILKNVHTVTTPSGIQEEIIPFKIKHNFYGASATVGKRITTTSKILVMRPELEYMYFFGDMHKKHYPGQPSDPTSSFATKIKNNQALFFNMNVEKPIAEIKSGVFVGAGVGANYKAAHSTLISNPDTFVKNKRRVGFAWELMVGATHHIKKNARINLAYKYINLGTVKYGTMNTTSSLAPALTFLSEIRSSQQRAHTINMGFELDF